MRLEIHPPPLNKLELYLKKTMLVYRKETSELDENHSHVFRYAAKWTCSLPGEQVRGGFGSTSVGQRYLG